MNTWFKGETRAWVLFIIFLLIGVGGDQVLRMCADSLGLPLWFDSLGILLCTFTLGLWGGILSGIGTSALAALYYGPINFVYVIPAVCIALVTRMFVKSHTFSTLGDALGLTLALVVMAVLICVPINFSISDGMTGLKWGDAVILFLEEHDFSRIRFFIGQLYVEFLDKAITVALFYLLVHYFLCFRRLQSYFERHRLPLPSLFPARAKPKDSGSKRALFFLAVLVTLGGYACPPPAQAISYNYSEVSAQMQESMLYAERNVFSMQQTVYDSNNGLSCGEANALAKTSDGAIWVGTYAGLFRFNGKEFRVEPNFKSIRSVISLHTDISGHLWVGTNGQGVMMCNHDNIVLAITSAEGLPSDNIAAICSDTDEFFYISTAGGLATMSSYSTTVVHTTELGESLIISMAAAPNNYVGAISSDGYLHILLKGKLMQSLEPISKKSRYTAVGFSLDNHLYATTADGVLQKFYFNGEEYVFEDTYHHENISEVKTIHAIPSDKGEIIFICADSGIFFLQDGQIEQLQVDDFNNSIESCVQDYQDNLWFASSRLGLLKLAHTPVSNIYQSAKLPPAVVNCVENWQGLLYIGTDDGLTVIEPKSEQPILNTYTDLFEHMRIRQMLRDSQDYLWVCTYGKGVYRLSLDGSYRHYTAQDGLFGDKVRTVFEYSPTEIMVAGAGGYSVFDHKGQLSTPNHELAKMPAILCMGRDSEGTLYLGTNGQGLAVIKDHKVDHYITQRDGLVSNVIMRIVPGSTKDLFYLVTGNGLCLMDPDHKVRSLDNFPYYDNFDVITAQDGLLFVTGSSGIYVINEKALLQGADPLSYVRLDNKSGFSGTLTANSWNYEDEHNNLYLAGSTGVFKLNTYRYHQQKKTYRLSLREIGLDQEVFSTGTGLPIQIPRKIKRISFYPEVINFSSENPQVGHYLEGLEDSYSLVRLSDLYEITYTNLPPGHYRLHVAVFRDDGSTKIAETYFDFEKVAAFYDSQMFFVYLYTVAGLMIAYLTFYVMILWARRRQEADRMLLELTKQQVRMGDETILTIAQALDARDQRTQQHSKRVSEYSVLIARELGFDDSECENLRKVALLHDIGKIGIPDRILNKPGRLTDEEYAVMKSHVVIGADILKNFSSFSNVADGVRYHHERFDGKGYAQGLKGEEIPLYGRIIAVADTFDAMTANRVYRKKLSIEVVLEELERCKGTQFDPRCADIMIDLVKEGKIKLDVLYAEEINALEDEIKSQSETTPSIKPIGAG